MSGAVTDCFGGDRPLPFLPVGPGQEPGVLSVRSDGRCGARRFILAGLCEVRVD